MHNPKTLLLVSLLIVCGLSVVSAQSKRFTLQVEATDSSCTARDVVHELHSLGVDAYYLKTALPGKGIFYRVRVGNFPDQAAAIRKGEQLLRARLIREYYVTRYDGTTYEAGPSEEINGVPQAIPASYKAVTAPSPTTVMVSSAPANARMVATTRFLPTPTNANVSLATAVDPLGSGFQIANGSVLAAMTSNGIITKRDMSDSAVITYPGLEASLKLTAGVPHEWALPVGAVAADLLMMEVNREAGVRQFFTASDPIHHFIISAGRAGVPKLEAGEYMIRVRLNTGQFTFQPLSVRGSERATVQTN